MNRPVMHLYPAGENCLWFSKPSSKICGESIKQICLQLLLLAMTSEFEGAVHPSTPAGGGKMGFGRHYTQTIQSFTPVNNNASLRSRMFQLDASKHSGQRGDITWSVPVVCVLACSAEQIAYTAVCLCAMGINQIKNRGSVPV